MSILPESNSTLTALNAQAYDSCGIAIPSVSTMPVSIATRYADSMLSLDLSCAAASYRVAVIGEDMYLASSMADDYLAKKAEAKEALRRAVLFLDRGAYMAKAFSL